PRRALALIAARFYATQPETAVAVTGTSGKTSVAEFTRQLFAAAGHKAASLGTIGVVKPDGAVYGSLTTPDPVTLHETLAALAREGVTHLAFEASSHGLDQYRLDGVRIAAAAFTNLGRDHLDYHPTTEAYLAAKLRLFEELLPDGAPAVVNVDAPRAEDVVRVAKKRGLPLITVGAAGETVRLEKLDRDGFAQRLAIAHAGRTYNVRLPLIGTYQVANALVALGLALAVGEDPAVVIPALAALTGVKGRLDIVGERNGGLAVVDYAHKPEALEAALDGVRPFATGKLICVFGCGGDRDRGKRPIMGAISVKRADVTIITDDNPRTEDPAAIRAEILASAPGATEIGDRGEAIRTAVAMMQPGDVVLVAGKGHETGQIVGQRVLPFSDHDCLRQALLNP
ncbi:MAG: UDP-N-acetylmuramoyl-L-alanyl-D-glutamate--2,6-diaminopimelate ligase, partial [Rhizobiales bacterium]|nr:UDP-N-acetylmuramoyl-L-alanyl-D-glutamate--2,6-diaminopimelate ligase [Hyphomicrobiales bacterium]